jgi:ATP-binding cassette, subfamily B, bacterial
MRAQGGGVTEEEKLDAEQAKWVMRRAARWLKPYRRIVILGGILVVIWTLTILAGPALIRYAIDHGIRPQEARPLNIAIGLYVVVAIVSYVSMRGQIVMISRAGENFLRDLRKRVFDHMQSLSMGFYDREKSGVLISRMTSDVDSLQELVQMGLMHFVSAVLLLVVTAGFLLFVSWELFLITLIAVPFVAVASIKFQRDSNRAYLTVRDRIGQTLTSLQEGISGVRVIQAFGREDIEVNRFTRRNRTLYDAHMDSVRIQAWYLPVIEFAGIGTTAAVVGVGAYLASNGVVTTGDVAFFVLALSNLFEPIQQLSQLFNQLQSAGAALAKLFQLLDTKIELVENPNPTPLPDRGEIRVEGMSFAYGDGPRVLNDVDLSIAPAERIALVGPTGAGKSTLAKLIARLYDPVEGRITFGGVDVRDASVGDLRRRIVVVPQEGFLFGTTIRENVRIARADATDEEVEDALRAIGAYERFASLPEGLETESRERGSRFSAGERQLVSLARAALVDPAVLVLDEATSSLDPGTEQLVEEAMERLMEGRTVIVIAHRLTTAERADRVGVVAEGHLAELGTHDELVAQGGFYAALYASWTRDLASRN